jgi:hypothetical protein
MDKIKALKEQLAALYKQDTKFHLSERNCVEILMKLIARGNLQVYFTLDGREYVTPAKLETEIKNELQLRGGRINILDLEPLLNIDSRQISAKVEELVSRYHHLHLVQGELISDSYLDKVAEEINESLQVYTQLTLVELAERFALPQEYLAKNIRKRLGTIIKDGILEEDILYTKTFLLRYKARIRGLLSAVTKPISIPHLLMQHQLHKKIFDSILYELLKEKRLAGELQGAYYVPYIFDVSRRNFIDSFFKQNGYIAYDMVAQMEYPNPKKFLQTTYTDGVALKTCFLSRHVIENIDASIAEALATESWLNVKSLLPIPLSRADALAVLRECSEVNEEKKTGPRPVILGECFVVSSLLLERIVKLLEDFYNTKTTTKKQNNRLEIDTSDSQSNAISSVTETKKTLQSRHQTEDSSATLSEGITKGDDNDTQRDGGGSGGERKKTDSSLQKNNTQSQSFTRSQSNSKTIHTSEVSSLKNESEEDEESEVKELLKKCIPEYHDDDDENKEILQLIFEYLKPTLTNLKKKFEQRSSFPPTQSIEKKEKIKTLFEKFELFSANIQLFKKGIQDVDARHRNALDKYLLKTLCSDLLNVTMEIAVNDYHLPQAAVSTPGERSHFLQQLPHDLSKPFEKFIKSLDMSTDDFLRELKVVAEKMQLPLKTIDKKTTRNLLFGHRQESLKRLAEDTNPLTTFHLVVLILYMKVCGSIVYVPSRSTSILLPQLKSRVSDHIYTKLTEFNELLTKYLQTVSLDTSNMENCSGDPVLLQQLQSALPELKTLANSKDLNPTTPPHGK